MPLTESDIQELGLSLYTAMREFRTIPPLTESHPAVSIDDAYHISRAMLSHRLKNDGEKITGKKIGVTSDAVQKMLGVFQPDFGFLTDKMAYSDNADIPITGNLIQPRAEAEIAFKLKSDLRGPGVSETDVLAATEYIQPCFEIVDSRIDDWKIKIQDTIADNASCGVYVLGDSKIEATQLDLSALQVKVYKNNQQISEGIGAAVQGNPLTAVAWLANTLGNFDIPFHAGEIILSGSLVPLEPAAAGDRFHMELYGTGLQKTTASCGFV